MCSSDLAHPEVTVVFTGAPAEAAQAEGLVRALGSSRAVSMAGRTLPDLLGKANDPAAAVAAAPPASPAAPAAATPAAPAPPAAAAPVENGFDRSWKKWLHDGIVTDSAFSPKVVTLKSDVASQVGGATPGEGLEVVFRPDPTVHDGRFANNAWLQELPKALTKLTWDNAALIAPATADRLQLISGDIVELKQGNRVVAIPVWLAPVQVIGIPVAGAHRDYLENVAQRLRSHGVRVEVDGSDERMQKKIRTAQTHKVPYMLIAGDDDIAAEAVSFRLRDGSQRNGIPIDQAIDIIVESIRSKAQVDRKSTRLNSSH